MKHNDEHKNLFNDAAFTRGCVCPGDTLTYNCTTMGLGFTVWSGTAFDCYEITLRNQWFMHEIGDSCNNGNIVARSLSVEGNNYTSQLNVTVTPDTAGKTIVCYSDNGQVDTLISSFVIPTTGLSCFYFSYLYRKLKSTTSIQSPPTILL